MIQDNRILKDKTAIVTGSRMGIGKAIAIAFAQAGADLIINDMIIDDGRLDAVAKEIRYFGSRCLPVQADVTDPAAFNDLVDQAIAEFGSIDILVNNVGSIVRKPLIEHTEAEWDKIINANLKSAFICTQAVAPSMVTNKKGCIINMSSVCSVRASVARGAYNVAKAGLSMMTKVLALELAGSNVRVNAIAPGGVKTSMNKEHWNDAANLLRPMKRMAEPEEIIGAAVYLASEASSYVTGHVLFVDGGESL